MTFLTKPIADALCTAITLGCFKVDGPKLNVQYEKTGDKPDHDLVEKAFTRLGVAFTATPSPPQSEMAYILAKTPKVPNFNYAKALTADYLKYLRAITASANPKPQATTPAIPQKPAPKGAYIGGMSAIGKVNIIGPSVLQKYSAQFRQVTDDTAETSYRLSAQATNDALACLKKDTPAATPTGIKMDFTDLGKPIVFDTVNKNLAPGQLFGSYHGMVLAMTKYQNVNDDGRFFFEIALGENTSKVSSCMPCSMFMLASAMPATSTHMGRGDNWKLPACLAEKTWREKINDYYNQGKTILAGKPELVTMFKAIDTAASASIPDVFLEALTFEGSFIDKIKATLKP